MLARGWGHHIELLEVRWGEEGGNTRPNGFTGNDDPIQHAKGTRRKVQGEGEGDGFCMRGIGILDFTEPHTDISDLFLLSFSKLLSLLSRLSLLSFSSLSLPSTSFLLL